MPEEAPDTLLKNSLFVDFQSGLNEFTKTSLKQASNRENLNTEFKICDYYDQMNLMQQDEAKSEKCGHGYGYCGKETLIEESKGEEENELEESSQESNFFDHFPREKIQKLPILDIYAPATKCFLDARGFFKECWSFRDEHEVAMMKLLEQNDYPSLFTFPFNTSSAYSGVL